jgi:diguanylate cyclase (GGDEF)-like protein
VWLARAGDGGNVNRDERRPRPRQPIFAGARPAAPDAATRDTQKPDLGPILASIGEAAYAWDIETDTLAGSENAGAVLGVGDAGGLATGRGYARLLAPDTAVTRFDAVMESGRDNGPGVAYQIEYALLGAGGDARWIEDTGRWFGGSDGTPRRAHGVVRVVNERHAEQERLAYLSKADALTGEVNRWNLTDALAAALEEAVRDRGSCAFLLVAIDNLAHVNEAYGYDVADEAIGTVASRLRAKLRTGDVLGRFSGNTFGVVLRNCTADEMAVAAERLLCGVRDDVVQTREVPIALTITIGGVIAPRHARDLTETLSHAQEALDAAKAKRPGSFVPYRPSIERAALRRENVAATDEIVAALNERRIVLAFEPVVEAASRRIAFREALMRIARSDGTMSDATAIIPIAERLGLVRLLDHRVLELAVTELVAAPDLALSLNVSPASTVDPDWWAELATRLKAHAGVGERLRIEITEMAAIHDIDETRGFVARVKDLGCRIAIDDFGAGYTSFRNLRRLDVDMIKIDGAFVKNVTRSGDDRIFVKALIDLGHALGLTTVAEWVQSEQAAQQLTAWGCDYLQGEFVGLAATGRTWTAPPAARNAG